MTTAEDSRFSQGTEMESRLLEVRTEASRIRDGEGEPGHIMVVIDPSP